MEAAIYVRDVGVEALRGWAGRFLGPLRPVHEDAETGTFIFHGGPPGPVVPDVLCLQTGIDGGLFTEVWLKTSGPRRLPWREDYECARQAARDLGAEVLCDPGPLRRLPPEDPFEWLRVTSDAEALVTWGESEEEPDEAPRGVPGSGA